MSTATAPESITAADLPVASTGGVLSFGSLADAAVTHLTSQPGLTTVRRPNLTDAEVDSLDRYQARQSGGGITGAFAGAGATLLAFALSLSAGDADAAVGLPAVTAAALMLASAAAIVGGLLGAACMALCTRPQATQRENVALPAPAVAAHGAARTAVERLRELDAPTATLTVADAEFARIEEVMVLLTGAADESCLDSATALRVVEATVQAAGRLEALVALAAERRAALHDLAILSPDVASDTHSAAEVLISEVETVRTALARADALT